MNAAPRLDRTSPRNSLATIPPTTPLRLHATLAAIALALLLALAGSVVLAQEVPLPPRYAQTWVDVDLPGGDLGPLFDVTFEQCHDTCIADPACSAYTYDERNAACFPKQGELIAEPFPGAISAIVTKHDRRTLDRAREVRSMLAYLPSSTFEDAAEMARTLPLTYAASGRSEGDLLDTAAPLAPLDALGWVGAAVTVNDSGEAWLAYAYALEAAAAADEPNDYGYHRDATLAALNAALRLEGRAFAEALVVLAGSLDATYRGEYALAAIQMADDLTPGIDDPLLIRLAEQYGFRLVEHTTDVIGDAPRICVRFSEPLSSTIDYAPYLAGDAARLAVEVEDQSLCFLGVAYGDDYRLTFREGLPSAAQDRLVRDVTREVRVADREPQARFPGRGYVLPATGPRSLPVETVNVDSLDLRLLYVSDRNLVNAIRDGDFLANFSYWDGTWFENRLAEVIWEGEVAIEAPMNADHRTLLPLAGIGALDPGMYVLRASIPGVEGYRAPPASQWFLVSDLGVTVLDGEDGIHVLVQRLSTGQPVEGAEVTVLARSNRTLAEGTTDPQGRFHAAAGMTNGTGNAAPALVLVERDEDFTSLSLAEPAFDLSDRGVVGRTPPGPIDVFATSDRGVYRPGETVHLTVLLRDREGHALTGLPVTARLLRPDGMEYASHVSTADVAGGRVVAFDLGSSVPRGTWRVETFVDTSSAPLAQTTILVEDFIPERIDVAVRLDDEDAIDVRAPPILDVDAAWLFGAPAADLALAGEVRIAASAALEGWPGYRFGAYDQEPDPIVRTLPRGLSTDASGSVATRLPVAGVSLEARPYEARILVNVDDGSGRPTERTLDRAVALTEPVVGIRPAFEGTLARNAEAEFALAVIGVGGAPQPGTLTWRINEVRTRYQWFSVGGSWDWEAVTYRVKHGEGTLAAEEGHATLTVPIEWGRYELIVRVDGSDAVASVPFRAGWYAAGGTRDTPDLLDVALDRPSYVPGDVATLQIHPEGAGLATVMVLSDRVLDLRTVPVDGPTTVELPVTDAWGAGAYVAASLLRPSATADPLPNRSLGLAYATVVRPGREVITEILVPDEVRSNAPLEVGLQVSGIPDGPAFATVAAVDVGALNLTGFEAPDPLGYLYGQRRLGVDLRDLYGRLIDAREGAVGTIRSGAGEEATEEASGPVPAEEVVAFFSGPVEIAGGRATVSFDVPPFAGTLRLMAVTWSERAVGQASADVIVRDPIVVQASVPRFLTPGDTSRLSLSLTHVTGSAGEMQLELRGHGLGDVPATVELEAGGRAVLDVPLEPFEVGDHALSLRVSTPDGFVATRTIHLSVLRTDPVVARTERIELAANGVTTLSPRVFEGFVEDTARASVTVGASRLIDLAGVTLRLGQYPYGCSEQQASMLYPLLFAPDVAIALGVTSDSAMGSRMQEGIDRILTRQASDGGFGLWSTYGGGLWLDAYLTEVLLRASAAGAAVPDAALELARANLRNELALAGGMYDDVAAYAYAAYVLAMEGDAVLADLRYYADELAERFDTPLAAAHLAAALAAYGETERSNAMFVQAETLALETSPDARWRNDYGTVRRDRAAVLALAVEAGTDQVDRVRLARLVTAGARADWTSTQEAAWMVRAAAALRTDVDGLVLDGAPLSGTAAVLRPTDAGVLRNEGDMEAALTITTFGVPREPPPAGGEGYVLRRTLYQVDGEPLDRADVRVGDRVVVVLEVRRNPSVPGGRLMIDDPLAAGFEIDNANLLAAADLEGFAWLDVPDEVAMTEARSERFLAAVDWTAREPFRVAYVMRAVSPGTYHYAAARVEDMYRSRYFAVTDTGRITIRR